jgi:hypothetical protein
VLLLTWLLVQPRSGCDRSPPRALSPWCSIALTRCALSRGDEQPLLELLAECSARGVATEWVRIESDTSDRSIVAMVQFST